MLRNPDSSILLLGPRATGKSTWIKEHFTDSIQYDLLDNYESLRLSKAPHLLYDELKSNHPINGKENLIVELKNYEK